MPVAFGAALSGDAAVATAAGPPGRAGNNRTKAAAELPNEQTRTVKAQPVVAPREVKREARPDPDKPGWGRTISL